MRVGVGVFACAIAAAEAKSQPSAQAPVAPARIPPARQTTQENDMARMIFI
jgi:hypothetical protein